MQYSFIPSFSYTAFEFRILISNKKEYKFIGYPVPRDILLLINFHLSNSSHESVYVILVVYVLVTHISITPIGHGRNERVPIQQIHMEIDSFEFKE